MTEPTRTEVLAVARQDPALFDACDGCGTRCRHVEAHVRLEAAAIRVGREQEVVRFAGVEEGIAWLHEEDELEAEVANFKAVSQLVLDTLNRLEVHGVGQRLMLLGAARGLEIALATKKDEGEATESG